MSAKTKIVVIKLKDLLFYSTVVVLCIIVLLMMLILFQPDTTTTNSTIEVKTEHILNELTQNIQVSSNELFFSFCV